MRCCLKAQLTCFTSFNPITLGEICDARCRSRGRSEKVLQFVILTVFLEEHHAGPLGQAPASVIRQTESRTVDTSFYCVFCGKEHKRQNWLVSIISQALGLRSWGDWGKCIEEVVGGVELISFYRRRTHQPLARTSNLGRDSIYLNHITTELGWTQFLGEFFK